MSGARPTQFSISPEAATEMKAFLLSYVTDEPKKLFIIGLALATRVSDGVTVGRGPAVGIERRSNVSKDDIMVVNDLEIALGMTEADAAVFSNNVLDFENGRFVLKSA